MELNFHGTDDQLEQYALGKLSDPELSVLEEHLLVCASCRERLDQTEHFVLGMREALKTDAAEPPSSEDTRLWEVGRTWIRKPAVSMALGFAALVITMIAFSGGKPKLAPSAALQLTAVRGDVPSAKQARALDLTLTDAPPAGGPFKVEVLDSAGQRLWSGLGADGAGGVEVEVQRILGPGYYFVRMSDTGGKVLHEYGFRIR